MEDNYSKACKEVLEVLNYVPQENIYQIPKELIEGLKEKADNSYMFKIDESKPFEEQILLDETQGILANIFFNYWATEDEKQDIKERRKKEEIEIEEEKKKNFENIDFFKNNIERNRVNIEINESSNLPVSIEKQNFFQKLVNFIKNIFRRG